MIFCHFAALLRPECFLGGRLTCFHSSAFRPCRARAARGASTPAPPQKRPQAGPVAKAERGSSAGATAIGGNVFHIQADVFQILFVFHFVLQDFAQYMGGKQVFIFYHFQ